MAQTKAQLLGPVVGDVVMDVSTLSLDAEGNKVGIGTTGATATLHVFEPTEGDAVVQFNSGDNFPTVNRGLVLKAATGPTGYTGSKWIFNAQSSGGRLEFQTASSPRLTILEGGNIGIGEISPDVRLHVKKQFDTAYSLTNVADEANHLLKLENPSTTANAFSGMQFRVGSGADLFFGAIQQSVNHGDFFFANQNSPQKEMMRIKSDGNVGIGTDNPGAKLQIKGTGGGSGLTFRGTDSSGNTNFWIQDGGKVGVHYYPLVINQDYNDTATPSSTYFYVHGSSPFIIKSDGKVGVGEDTPASQIDIKGNVSSTTQFSGFDGLRVHNANGSAFGVTADMYFTAGTGSSNRGAAIGSELVSGYGNDLYFATNAGNVSSTNVLTERLRITAAGQVLINQTSVGTKSAPAPLQLISSSSGAFGLNISMRANNDYGFISYTDHDADEDLVQIGVQRTAANTGELLFYTNGGNASATERLRITSDGNVSIGAKSNPDWNSTVDALTVGYAGVLYEDSYSSGTDNYVILGNNIFYSGSGGNKYIRNDEAQRIMMQAGTFYFQSASTGTAGNAITFADKVQIQSDRVRIYGDSNYFTDIIGNSQTTTANVREAGCRFIGPEARRMYFEIKGNDATDHIRFITSPNNNQALDYVAMHIGNNGNVGIGEIEPTNRLVVQKVNASGDVGVRIKNDTLTDGNNTTPTTASLYLNTSTGDFNTCYIQARRNDGDTHFGYSDPRASGHVPNMVISNDGMVTKPKNVAWSYRRGGSLGSWGSNTGLTYPSLSYRTPLPLFGSTATSTDYDTHSSLSTFSSGGGTGMKFTAPVAGKYMVVLNMTSVRCHVQTDWGSIGLMVNTTAAASTGSLDYMLDTKYTPDQSGSGTDQFGWGGSCIISLAANDYIVPYIMSCEHWSADNMMMFQGYLLG